MKAGRTQWMVSAVPMPRHSVHLVTADATYVDCGAWGYYYAICGHRCIRAYPAYRRELPVCATCSEHDQLHGKP